MVITISLCGTLVVKWLECVSSMMHVLAWYQNWCCRWLSPSPYVEHSLSSDLNVCHQWSCICSQEQDQSTPWIPWVTMGIIQPLNHLIGFSSYPVVAAFSTSCDHSPSTQHLELSKNQYSINCILFIGPNFEAICTHAMWLLLATGITRTKASSSWPCRELVEMVS